ncbi:hypothetical protein ES703_38709 [subsurface metagenome]
MWDQLAALLQVLNDQPDTALSPHSKAALEACIKTQTCNRFSLANVCSSLKCSFCGQVIGHGEFYFSCAIWRNPYIECIPCSDISSGWKEEKWDSLPEEDRLFFDSRRGIMVKDMTQQENQRMEDILDSCYEYDLPDDIEQISADFERHMAEDEKIVYPAGQYSKAHWEVLLLKRGVPLIPPQLLSHSKSP